MNVGSPKHQIKMSEKISTPQKVANPVIMLKLTVDLEDDWLRLYAHIAYATAYQSAAVLPCIIPLHRVNAEIQHIKTHHSL